MTGKCERKFQALDERLIFVSNVVSPPDERSETASGLERDQVCPEA